MNILSKIFLLQVLLLFSCKDEEITYFFSVYSGIPNELNIANSSSFIPVAGASVEVYLSEGDYLLGENSIMKGTTNSNGYLRLADNYQKESYWVKITTDTLNNLRFNDVQTELWGGGWGGSEFEKERGFIVRLSNTPTRLELQVNDDFVPAPDATVQLYLSESDYRNDITPVNNLSGLGKAYGNFTNANSEQLERELSPLFNGLTDKSGKILFASLEPRKYWMKVFSGNKSNNQSVIMTEGALENNPNITTSISISIN